MLCLKRFVTNCCNKVIYLVKVQRYNILMLKLYRDHNSHIAGVYQRDKLTALFLVMQADGIKCLAMSSSAFAKKYTHPMNVDPRKAALTWYCRALTKSRNDPRAFNLLGELVMEKKLEELTMDELVEHHNEVATGHGGFLGVLIAMALWAKKQDFRWLTVTDFIAPLVPLGLAAGRIGNFINGELWGRLADASLPWAMAFPQSGDLQPRHPSQLYHVGLEGFALFAILWLFTSRPR